MRSKIVAGNWKLHGTRSFATGLVAEVAVHSERESANEIPTAWEVR